jgi:hypothetical protein
MVEGLQHKLGQGGYNQAREAALVKWKLSRVTNRGKDSMGEYPQKEDEENRKNQRTN